MAHITGALPVWDEFNVLPANVYDSLVGGTDYLDTSLVQWLGIAPSALTSNAVQVSVAALQSGVVTATSLATGAITNAKFAASAIDATAIASNAISATKAKITYKRINIRVASPQ